MIKVEANNPVPKKSWKNFFSWMVLILLASGFFSAIKHKMFVGFSHLIPLAIILCLFVFVVGKKIKRKILVYFIVLSSFTGILTLQYFIVEYSGWSHEKQEELMSLCLENRKSRAPGFENRKSREFCACAVTKVVSRYDSYEEFEKTNPEKSVGHALDNLLCE